MIEIFEWLFPSRERAIQRIQAAVAHQWLHEKELLAQERPDLKPYPLRLRYDADQRLLAVYQRVLKAYAKAKGRPPRNLRDLVKNAKQG